MKALVIGGGGREHALAWRLLQVGLDRPGLCRARQRRHGHGRCRASPPISGSPKRWPRWPKPWRRLHRRRPRSAAGRRRRGRLRSARPADRRPDAASGATGGQQGLRQGLLSRRVPHPDGSLAETVETVDLEAALDKHRRSGRAQSRRPGRRQGRHPGRTIAKKRSKAAARCSPGEAVGAPGSRLLVEEFLVGREVSFIVLSDGERIFEFRATQDHKGRLRRRQGPQYRRHGRLLRRLDPRRSAAPPHS